VAALSGGTRLSFGIKTSQSNIDYDDIVRIWRDADATEVLEHAWLWDHLVPLRGEVTGTALEAWTLLAALAAQTQRLNLGVIVTSNRIRPPAVLAKMAATVDVIANGRLIFGIGAGGSQVPGDSEVPGVHREFDAYGLPVVSAAEAIGSLGEACSLIRQMWTEKEPFDFDGKYYQLKGAVCEPKPVQRPYPPIMIGGGGEKYTLRVVAEHADIWNCPARSAEEIQRKGAVLDEHCAAIGRDPKAITRSMQVMIRPGEEAAAVRDKLVPLIEAGVNHLVLAPIPPLPSVRWLADEIVEPLLTSGG
jgi:alkanesulfonate monooxygenase SsuD/methylene tetrahydromethanopterin reductase-like flavin-dependent oxidoreductase (luciferase family)